MRASRHRLAAIAASLLVTVTSLVALAPDPARAAVTPIVDGNARFEVLTPTLIRLEYAGDAAFQDGTTFNAINRNFTPPAYTTSTTADGYREIHTDALTLRYRRNSGPFTAANLTVALTTTGTTATPIFPSYCVISALCEAENALVRPHAGNGFIAGFEGTGSGIEQDVSAVPAAGTYRLAVRYANAVGSDGQSTTRTLSTRINGAAGPQLSLPPTASWDTWSTASVQVSLAAGTNTIAIAQNAGDSGRVNLDSFAVTPTSSTGYPGAANT